MDPQLTDLTSESANDAASILSGTTFNDAVQQTWAAHCSVVGDREREYFESRSKTIHGFKEYLETLESACRKNQVESLGLKIVDWFQPIFKLVELLAPAAQVAVQAYPNPGSLVLGGLVAILQTTDRMIRYQKLAVQMLAKMGTSARLLFDYEGELFKDDKSIQTALLDVYGDIVNFCQKAFRLVSKKDTLLAEVKGKAKLLVRDFESHLGEEVTKFEQHMQHLADRVTLQNSWRLKTIGDKQHMQQEQAEVVRKEAQEHFERQEDFASAWKRDQDLRERRKLQKANDIRKESYSRWLSSESFHDSYEEKCDEYLDGTGSWFLESDHYKAWKFNKTSDLLWIKGKAGSGKSVLTAMAVDLNLRLEKNQQVALAYAFCRKEHEAKQNASALLRALTRDVCAQQSEVNSELESAYQDTLPSEQPHKRIIRRILSSAMKKFSTTFLVVDALDESQDVMELARDLLGIMREQTSGNVKILVSSRPDPRLEEDLFKQYKHLEPEENNQDDLKAYIDDQFPELPEVDVNKEIREACVEKAQGMFLWVKLLALSLQKPMTLAQKRKRIQEVPSGLRSMYDRMLKEAWGQDEDQRSDAFLVLLWVLFAKRPLEGTEMLEAVIDYTDCTSLQAASPFKHRNAKELVLKCANLVYIDKDQRFRLCHESVREYLAKSPLEPFQPLLDFQQLEKNAHERLAEICLKYLSLKDFECGPAKDKKTLIGLVRKAPFLEYAADFWGWHARQQGSQHLTNLVKRVVRSPPRRELSMQIVLYQPSQEDNHWRFTRQSNPLHILAAFGLKEIASTMPNVANLSVKADQSGCTPLTYALIGNHAEMCLWLFEHGQIAQELAQNPRRRLSAIHRSAALGWTLVLQHLFKEDKTFVNTKLEPNGPTPLVRACGAGHLDAAEVLIDHGADVDLKDGDGDTPLVISAVNRHQSLVVLLLERHALVNCEDSNGQTPLHFAADNGDVDIAQALLDYHADPLRPSKQGDNLSPAHCAASANSVEILTSMHEVCSDLSQKARRGISPLHMTAWFNKFAAAKALLELGVAKDAKDDEGQTPLYIAAQEGALETVGELIDAKCDISIPDLNGKTAIHAAASGGSVEILTCILASQPVTTWEQLLNCRSSDNETPLHVALREGHVQFARALLDCGANAALTGSLDSSPLHYAAHYGLHNVIRTILDHAPDPNPKNKNLETPLHFAARAKNTEFVVHFFQDCAQLNLEVDVEAQNDKQRTALKIALDKGCENLAEILIDKSVTSVADVDGNYPIHEAAWHAFDPIVSKLLSRDGVTAKGYHDRTPFNCAAVKGNLTTLKLLEPASLGILDCPDKEGWTPVMAALSGKHFEVANYLITIGADCHLASENGNTLLHIAAGVGHLEIVKRLLKAGCKGDSLTIYGETPFHRAVVNDHVEIVDEFLAQGLGHAKALDALGTPCIASAASTGNLNMLEKLELHGAVWGIVDDLGRGAAHYAAENGYWNLFTFLQRHGEDLNRPDHEGYTPLITAANDGHPDTVRYLLKENPDAVKDVCNGTRNTALLSAVKECRPLCVRALLEAGADPYHLDGVGLNALDYALGHRPLLREMIKAGRLHNPNSLEIQGPILCDTIRRSCQKILSCGRDYSTARFYTRNAMLIVLYDSLRRVQDYDGAKICAMELLWTEKSDLISATFQCQICGAKKFTGDKNCCKSCNFAVILCNRCHEDYVKSGNEAPEGFQVMTALEGIVRSVRDSIDDSFSLTGLYYAMNYWNVGADWVSTVADGFETWEQRFNYDNRYRDFERPGQELIKMVKRMKELSTKAMSSAEVDPEDKLESEKLRRQYLKYRTDKEVQEFPCKGHEYFSITTDERDEVKSAGKNIDSQTGRLTDEWLRGIVEKYSQVKLPDGRSKTTHRFATDDSTGSVPERERAPFMKALKRSLSLISTPTVPTANGALFLALVAKNKANAAAPQSPQEFVKRNQTRRAQTLPLLPGYVQGSNERIVNIQVKDAAMIEAIKAKLDPKTETASREELIAAAVRPQLTRTLSIALAPASAPNKTASKATDQDSDTNNTKPTDQSTSSNGAILAPTLSSEPESTIEPSTPDEESPAVSESGLEPVATVTTTSTVATENTDTRTSHGSPNLMRIAYQLTHTDVGSDIDIDLWSFALNITEAMIPGFIEAYFQTKEVEVNFA